MSAGASLRPAMAAREAPSVPEPAEVVNMEGAGASQEEAVRGVAKKAAEARVGVGVTVVPKVPGLRVADSVGERVAEAAETAVALVDGSGDSALAAVAMAGVREVPAAREETVAATPPAGIQWTYCQRTFVFDLGP